jgi:hypothetical protein
MGHPAHHGMDPPRAWPDGDWAGTPLMTHRPRPCPHTCCTYMARAVLCHPVGMPNPSCLSSSRHELLCHHHVGCRRGELRPRCRTLAPASMSCCSTIVMAAMGTSYYTADERRKCVSEEEEVRESESIPFLYMRSGGCWDAPLAGLLLIGPCRVSTPC